MARNKDEKAWFYSLPKEKQALLDLWEEQGLNWTSGPQWKNKPHSVELERYTNAGGDMIIALEDISADALEKYIDDFDVNAEVALWWPDGQPGRGVPFASQAEHVADLEDWLAGLRDIVDLSRGDKHTFSSRQRLAIDKFVDAYKALKAMGVAFTWCRKKEFTFKIAEQ